MKCAILNQQGHNFGDEIAGCALIDKIFAIDDSADISVLYASDSPLPISNSNIHHYLECSLKNVGILRVLLYLLSGMVCFEDSLQSRTLTKWISIIKQSDIVFVSPCGASIGRYKDWRYVLRLLIAIKTGAHLQFHYNTIESSSSVIFDLFANYILKHSTVRVREIRCQEYLKTKGIQSTWGPDSAFAVKKKSIINEATSKSDVIGFVPAEFANWHPSFRGSDVDSIVKEKIYLPMVSFAQSRGYLIKIIPHFNNDLEDGFCNRTRDVLVSLGLDLNKVFVDSELSNCFDYDKSIASCQLLIGMRYHAIVLASKNAVPFLSLSYEEKMNEVCRYTHMSEYNINLYSDEIIKINVESVLEKVDEERELIYKKLKLKSKELRDGLYSDTVCELLR